MFKTLVLVGIGGALGSVLRYLTTLTVTKYFSTIFPWATFIINVLGCLLIGIIMGLLEKNQLTDSSVKWLLVTGFCGGYTTFSAFGYENISLLQNGNTALTFLYIITSVVIGLMAVWLGLSLVK
ncbi:fluoride efflux transporter CrcB [Flavobacterium sp. CYK-4]|uniref:fluoride efflux transporter CrcB n=1 Tax=Flavobacterium lotistagni TaxID=2709660 RepID=UPI00140ABDCC|nr:fluoride efflux transporter CrcB [Flavobacterium lotistagni]NHM07766.1 fluoride efflux transporter CrcB [Flavobacterium lotistagni]